MDNTNYEQQTKAILESTAKTPWPSFTGLEGAAFDILKNEFKDRFGLSLWDDVIKINQSQIDSIKDAITPGDNGPDLTAWKNVLSAVEEVVADMTTVQTFIEGQKVFLMGSHTIIYKLAQQTMGYVGLKQSDPPPPSPFPLSSLLDIVLSPLSLAVIPFGIGSSGAGIIKGIIGFIRSSNAQRDGSKAVKEEQKLNDFTLASLDFERQLTDQFTKFTEAASLVENITSTDYGKLRDFAKLLNNSNVVWPSKQSSLTQEGMQALEIGLWKFFLPARWPITQIVNPEEEVIMPNLIAKDEKEAKALAKGQMTIWPQTIWEATGKHWGSRYGHLIHWEMNVCSLADSDENGTRCNTRLPDASANRLFNVLKVPRTDVFHEQNGWSGFKKEEVLWRLGHGGKEVLGG